MNPQLSKLLKMLRLWLKKNSLEGDLRFYEIDEWRKRKEPYLNDSEFVITTEGGLNFLLNYGDPNEFYNLIDSFGYYIEMGHSWNFGFYKALDEPDYKPKLSYSEKLRDERWQRKRKFILDRASNKCEDCDSRSHLEIHHCYYMYGYEPWEYPFDSLRCLCRACHEERGPEEQLLRSHISQLTTNELETLIGILDRGLLMYNRNELFTFIDALNKRDENLPCMLSRVVNSKRF